MHLLPLTLDEPAANLALDEALLDAAETGGGPAGILRLWEPVEHFIVLGRSSRAELELNREACRADAVPVLRRASGGATIVAGPGCLMYAVVLDATFDPRLPAIDAAHEAVLERIAAALAPLIPGAARSGTSDLTLPPAEATGPRRKFSGNSLRCRRRTVLYHGTLLYDFDLALIPRWLAEPPRQPEYRVRRAHGEFVANLPLTRQQLDQALRTAFGADELLPDWPRGRVAELVAQRYADPKWRLPTAT
ncbi:MAG: lipoate--protein ligase family protein [Planctomycetales bacterium]|nr:lipoate--protein ligase family protein [Planctomycetales bacterium]